jgi:hypothetical protein
MTGKHVFKDYFLTDDGFLYRTPLDESKHLMWQFKGVPLFNKEILMKYKPKKLGVRTNKRRFVIDAELFLSVCNEFSNKGEIQLWCDKYFYTISDLEGNYLKD